ncbi:33070_t:CDS:2, partial [Gigaspora margarita]
YQTAENDFKIINWKYFYPFNQPRTEFSTGDIVIFAGKFIIENLEQYITVSYACIIATGDPEQVFEASEILISTPHCMFPVQITYEQKEVRMKLRAFYPINAARFAYLHTNNNIRMGRTFIISGFVRRVTSDFTVVEVTDVDFITNNANTVQSVQIGSSSGASDNRSDIDLIIEDVDLSTPRTSKRPCGITSKYSNKSTNLPPVNIEPAMSILTPVNPINLNPGMVQNQK